MSKLGEEFGQIKNKKNKEHSCSVHSSRVFVFYVIMQEHKYPYERWLSCD